jgi:hypothetical protein
MFEGCGGNKVVICAIKPIVVGEELLINYNSNIIKKIVNYFLQFTVVIY